MFSVGTSKRDKNISHDIVNGLSSMETQVPQIKYHLFHLCWCNMKSLAQIYIQICVRIKYLIVSQLIFLIKASWINSFSLACHTQWLKWVQWTIYWTSHKIQFPVKFVQNVVVLLILAALLKEWVFDFCFHSLFPFL